jgi:hypothetical protein
MDNIELAQAEAAANYCKQIAECCLRLVPKRGRQAHRASAETIHGRLYREVDDYRP